MIEDVEKRALPRVSGARGRLLSRPGPPHVLTDADELLLAELSEARWELHVG